MYSPPPCNHDHDYDRQAMLQINYCEEQSLNAIKLLLITIFEMLLGFLHLKFFTDDKA